MGVDDCEQTEQGKEFKDECGNPVGRTTRECSTDEGLQVQSAKGTVEVCGCPWYYVW